MIHPEDIVIIGTTHRRAPYRLCMGEVKDVWRGSVRSGIVRLGIVVASVACLVLAFVLPLSTFWASILIGIGFVPFLFSWVLVEYAIEDLSFVASLPEAVEQSVEDSKHIVFSLTDEEREMADDFLRRHH